VLLVLYHHGLRDLWLELVCIERRPRKARSTLSTGSGSWSCLIDRFTHIVILGWWSFW